MGIFVKVVGIIACFMFAAGNAAAAAQALSEKKWDEFGCEAVLSQLFVMGIFVIIHMWLGL